MYLHAFKYFSTHVCGIWLMKTIRLLLCTELLHSNSVGGILVEVCDVLHDVASGIPAVFRCLPQAIDLQQNAGMVKRLSNGDEA